MMGAKIWCVAVAFVALSAVPASTEMAADLRVSVVSSRVGLVFTDAETPDVRASVEDAPGPTRITWHVRETEGPWQSEGRVAVPVENGRGEQPIPLDLPGRGHYTLALRAVSGDAVAVAKTSLGVVFPPDPPNPNAPWGIFHIPNPIEDPDDPLGAKAAARSIRLLGASWARLNFWSQSYDSIDITTKGGQTIVEADTGRWKSYARALRDEGIHIMGEIAQCPTLLSSRREDMTRERDMGPVANRAKPRDYAEWDALMTSLAVDYRDEIGVWEIWNEPDFRQGFWVGTPQEFAELVRHTSAALRRGNAEARIACSGFVESWDFADRLLELGVGEDMDVLSVHYTDQDPQGIEAWKAVLEKHGLNVPIWNTEEREEVPLANLAAGIPLTFKFLHVAVGYEASRPLVNTDFTPRPSALWFATGAHCLGDAAFVRRIPSVPAYDTYLFRRGQELIAAFAVQPFHNLFGPETVTHVVLAVDSLDADAPPTLTDRFGRSRPVAIADGKAHVTLDSSLMFLNGVRKVEVLRAEAGTPRQAGAFIFEAESGRMTEGWSVAPRSAYSGGEFVQIWADDEPGAEGHAVEVDVGLPEPGRYEVFFSGNPLTRLEAPRSLSPFTWAIDGKSPHLVNEATPGMADVMKAGEGLFKLGEVDLAQGRHCFILRLTARRETPDTRYALWFDAVVLHKLQGADTD